ncbi:MAG: glycosyltransferase family 39 protein [Microgenomates group bacterium]
MYRNWLLVLVLLFSFTIRIYKITSLPPALFSDEVDAGYQALVFNNSSTDYFGNQFPVHFHSFSDWRTSLQIYSIALVQKIVGTSALNLSIRLPSAIYGTISVYIFYLLLSTQFSGNIPLLGSLLLAISPWHIIYSRTGFEVSGMFLFILLGILFWQKFIISSHPKYLYLTVFSFCLTPYFYSTAKLFIIIIAICILIIWFPQIIKIKAIPLIISIFLGLLLLLPLISDTLASRAGFRFSYISIFTTPHREQVTDSLRYEDVLLNHPQQIGLATPPTSYLFHNKYQLVWQKFVENYFSAYSSQFLFIKGDQNLRQGLGERGLLYYLDFFLIPLGIISLFISKNKNRLSVFFLLILLTAPIPFALTRDSDSPHATRLLLMLPSLIYFSFLGLKTILQKSRIFFIICLSILTLNFITTSHYYHYHYPQISARSWHAGMQSAVEASLALPPANIYFSSKYEPFLPFFLLYSHYLPKDPNIQHHLTSVSNQFFDGQVLDNQYYFGNINWHSVPPTSNNLFVIPSQELTSATGYSIKTKIAKVYQNSEDFYVLSQN